MNSLIQAKKFHLLPEKLAAAAGRLTHLQTPGRGAVILVVLLGLAVISVTQLFPTRVTPADASPEQFSAERALAHQLRHRPPPEHHPRGR